MSTPEIFDVVNDRDEVIGTAPRPLVHQQSLWHRAVHVLLFNPRAKLFLQKRCAGKDSFPLCLDSSASGHLDSGEAYDDCAVRELREELGIAVPVAFLTKQFKIAACAQTGWEFVWVYTLQGDWLPQPNPDEIESGRFWGRAELAESLAATPESFAPCFRLVLAQFHERQLWPPAR